MLETIIGNILSFFVLNKYSFGTILGTLAFTVILWAMWVTLNVAYNRQKRLVYKILLYVGIIPGALLDIIYNKTVCWLMFLEWGQESTLSMRLTRYLKTKDQGSTIFYVWTKVQVATWLATYLIEPWSPKHIGLERFGYPAAKDLLTPIILWLKKRGI